MPDVDTEGETLWSREARREGGREGGREGKKG